MSGHDWLGPQRAEAASDRILDAATELFVQHDVSTVGMNDIARAAGCSRATLYRYFDSRDVLYKAYVDREANRLYEQMIKIVAEIDDPQERLLAAMTKCLKMVRQSPALSAWFAPSDSPIGAAIADRSEAIHAMVAGFLMALGDDEPAVIQRRARWLVRILVSLLSFPEDDEADERAMAEEFLIPIIFPEDRPVHAD